MLKPRAARTARARPARHGFTLIELMVTITVLAVALALAAPTFSTQLANFRVRAAAEAAINGLNYARTEAVRRNAAVEFTLDAAGSGWTVTRVSDGTTLQQRAGGDSPGTALSSSTTSLVVRFLATGLVDTTGTRLQQITVASAVTGAETRRIDIFGGGLIRMCDPGVAVADDPRRC